MKLYEVNLAIQQVIDQIDFDPETGEILCDSEALFAQLNALEMERKSILSYLAKVVLNLRSDAAALKTEEDRLKDRRKKLEAKEERLLSILDRECAGEKTDCGVATFSYRASTKVDISDSGKTVSWLKENGHEDCYRTPDPEVNKNNIKRLLKAGIAIPGASLIEGQTYSLK